ncbi:MAG: DUF3370 domain-containing protein [Planctomycetaceae bacterium]|nr:DUF3370 domain-containing protein [Planctomycetaceae bacterium]
MMILLFMLKSIPKPVASPLNKRSTLLRLPCSATWILK